MALVERIKPVRSENRDGLEQASESTRTRDSAADASVGAAWWVDREQGEGIAYLRGENRAMKVQLGGRRLRLVRLNGGLPIMLKEVERERHTKSIVHWPDLPLPLTAAERHRVSALLICMALAGLVALVVSFVSR